MFCRNQIGKPVARTHTICAHPSESKYNTKLVKLSSKSLNFNKIQLKKTPAFSLSGVPSSFNPHTTGFKTLCQLKTKDPKSFRELM